MKPTAPFKVDLRRLNEEGLDLQGSQPPSFFALTDKDPARATSPLNYILHVQRDNEDLLVTGSVSATFSIDCGRCLQPVEIQVHLDPYTTEIPIQAEDATIDLTEALREDILLTLPSYPRCEDGNVKPRECPAEGRFEIASTQHDAPTETATSQEQRVWDVLDQLKNR